jgi:hypothetical protein
MTEGNEMLAGDGSLDLSHSMKFADTIRKQYEQDEGKKKSFNSSIPPGAIQGASAALFTGVALLPVRRLILSQTGDSPIRTFVDLVLSVSHALAATQIGLMAGSIFGCQTYLQDFAKNPVTQESSVLVDRVCDTVWQSVLPKSFPREGLRNSIAPIAPAWDFRAQTMIDLQKAIECCHRRQDFLQENENKR